MKMPKRRLVEIVNRTTKVVEGKDIQGRNKKAVRLVTRELACGHRQPEPSGGEAWRATSAYCRTCGGTNPAEMTTGAGVA